MPGETPPSSACGESAASRRRRASSAWSGPQVSTASAPAASTRSGGTVSGKRPSKLQPERLGGRLEPLRGEAREAARAGGDRHARARSQLGDRPTEGDQVAARGRRQRDHGRHPLDVVRGGAVVPDDGAAPRAGARRVAAVGAEHEAAAGGLEVGVQPRGAPGIASIVLDPQRGPGALGPELQPGAHLHALRRVAAAQRDGRAYKRSLTSSSGLRSARAAHCPGVRAAGSRPPCG